MPKEIAHWLLAKQLQKKLSKIETFHRAVTRYPYFFLLGAVTPDIPFFYVAGPDRAKIQDLGGHFHRDNKTALAPALRFLGAERGRTQAGMALAAGVVCHLVSDTVFHPMVYYFSGKPGVHKQAESGHFRFETALDLHFRHLFRDEGPTTLGSVIRRIETSKTMAAKTIARLFETGGQQGSAGFGLALDYFKGFQYLFTTRAARRATRLTCLKHRWFSPKYAELVYPADRALNLRFFNRTIHYRDPYTGAWSSERIESLVQKTVTGALDLLGRIQAKLAARADLTSLISCPDLPEIRTCMEENKIRYQDNNPSRLADIYKLSFPLAPSGRAAVKKETEAYERRLFCRQEP